MQEIITWLRQVEALARDTYQSAAQTFQEDDEFAAFLGGLAEDEALHYDLMGRAAVVLEAQENFPPAGLKLDEATRARVESPLERCRERLRGGRATKAGIIADLIEAEHSEWNDIFLYVIRTCQGQAREFQRVAAIIDAHGRKIDAWVQGREDPVTSSGSLPRVWQPRFLVVEDDDALRELFRRILEDLGEVVTAGNGGEGLLQAKQGFFDVIVSDQDMPIMTGLELYRLGKELDPNLGQHFILCTGNATSEIRLFCRQEGVKLLEKPVSLTALRDGILDLVGARPPKAATS